MGLEYVDIFIIASMKIRRWKTASALAHAVQSGKALYVGISSYSPERTQKMVELLHEWKIPLLIHQPSSNLLNRWVDKAACWIPCKITAWAALPLLLWLRDC
ncbi:aldo/keto reductase [Escherichia coli]